MLLTCFKRKKRISSLNPNLGQHRKNINKQEKVIKIPRTSGKHDEFYRQDIHLQHVSAADMPSSTTYNILQLHV